MNMATIRNKLVEVRAAARVIVQRYGHTPKFAKHPVALIIKQIKGFTDEQLAEFLGTDLIGKQLGYEHKPNPSTFSKVRKRSDPRIFQELYIWLLQNLLKGKQLHLIAQDSTDIPAYSKKDKDARYGHKTPSKRSRLQGKRRKRNTFLATNCTHLQMQNWKYLWFRWLRLQTNTTKPSSTKFMAA